MHAIAGDDFPPPRNTEPSTTRPLSAVEAAAGFRAPAGFRVSVFAAEPDVQNPIAMAWDRRGRLWIAENYTYSDTTDRFDLRHRDRVLIFEDNDSDGRFDRRTVFTDDVQMLASIEHGFGGVWLLCPPRLLFVPDRDGNDVPDGPAEVVLDGFSVAVENHHTFANGLRWGPDGWLYGRCGASSPGQVGVPGTPEALRVPVRGGLWRYHPLRKRFEMLAHGTTNPWGHDWNALGEAFFINTVNGHLWHMIPGAHLVRPHTIEPNPRAYALIDQHADHWHWDNSRPLTYGSKVGPDDSRRGGGHAHSGLMIYLADQWPSAYRGELMTLNFHGRRMNVERLERDGSGYVGRARAGHALRFGPLVPWDRSGLRARRRRVPPRLERYRRMPRPRRSPPHFGPDLQGHLWETRIRRGWRSVKARRAGAGGPAPAPQRVVRPPGPARAGRPRSARQPLPDASKALRSLLVEDPEPVRKLRGLWSLYVIGAD